MIGAISFSPRMSDGSNTPLPVGMRKARAADWGNGLPMDILHNIFDRMPGFYHQSFACVCAYWRLASKELSRPSLPWLLLQPRVWPIDGRKGESCILLGAFGRDARMPYEKLGGHHRWWNFYGSSLDGHWALVHVGIFSREVLAVNHVTKVTIRLPHWPKPKAHCLKMFLFPELPPKASPGGFLAVGIVQYRCLQCQCLQFARDGDEEWTPLELPWESYNDVTFHDGKLYVVDAASNLLLCNLSGPPPLMTKIITRGGTSKSYKHFAHSSTGELLLVWKDGSWFGVARLDLSSGAEWVEVKTLGQDAILFDRRHALCISTEARPELRSSCIYFPDMVEETEEIRLGVFHLEGGRLEYQHLPHPPCPRSSVAHWLIPGFTSGILPAKKKV